MSDERESRKFELAPELVAVQNVLANLTPSALPIDRDQLMFNAGRAAERADTTNSASRVVRSAELAERLDPVRVKPASGRFWPAATATMTAATILLATMLLHERQPQSIVHDTKPTATIADSQGATTDLPFTSRTSLSRATTGYLGIRNTALSRGVGALATQIEAATSVSPPQSKPATARDLRDELLPTARQRG